MHSLDIRIYYEDTDAGERVYYANYLKYMERARSELLRSIGFESSAALKSGYGFVVADVHIAYKSYAMLDDVVEVRTSVIKAGRAKLVLQQNIYKSAQLLTESEVTLAFIDKAGKPARIPEEILDALGD